MASLLSLTAPKGRVYWDKSNFPSVEEQKRAMEKSATLYIGGLGGYTSEQDLYSFFSKAGVVKKIRIGLHRLDKTPCGFAFVEYFARDEAVLAQALLNGATLDEKILKVEIDPGFKEGRQYGRGRSGGQVKDDQRQMRQVVEASPMRRRSPPRRRRRDSRDRDERRESGASRRRARSVSSSSEDEEDAFGRSKKRARRGRVSSDEDSD